MMMPRKAIVSTATTLALVLVASPDGSNATNLTSLTLSNADELMFGKNALIKFYAPWCGACQAVALEFEMLADFFANNEKVLIAEVDCTTEENERLCDLVDIQVFPTVLYGPNNMGNLEPFEGALNYDELLDFCVQVLKKEETPVSTTCNVLNRNNNNNNNDNDNHMCSDAELAAIEKYRSMSVKELEAIVTDVKERLEKLQNDFDEETYHVEELYEDLMYELELQGRAIKRETKYLMMQQVIAARQQQQQQQLEVKEGSAAAAASLQNDNDGGGGEAETRNDNGNDHREL